jgi:hypothetical protein
LLDALFHPVEPLDASDLDDRGDFLGVLRLGGQRENRCRRSQNSNQLYRFHCNFLPLAPRFWGISLLADRLSSLACFSSFFLAKRQKNQVKTDAYVIIVGQSLSVAQGPER